MDFREAELRLAISRENQKKRIEKYRHLNDFAEKGQIVMTGSSLMEHFDVNELSQNYQITQNIYNRGVGGFTTEDFIDNWNVMLFDPEPSKVFINIGTNDFNDTGTGRSWKAELLKNYDIIMDEIQRRLPEAKVYIMAYYPVNPVIPAALNPMVQHMLKNRTRENFDYIHSRLREMADIHGFAFIDVNEGLTDENGYMKPEFCVEGIHMHPNGYAVVLKNLLPYLQ